jgi:hypothetical protein
MLIEYIEWITHAALRGQIGCLCTTFVLRLLKLTLSIHDYLLSAQARSISPASQFQSCNRVPSFKGLATSIRKM